MSGRHRSSRGGAEPAPLPGMVIPGRGMSGPGDWPAIFGRRASLVVEIGFGKDTFLLERAAACPERDHVGVERDPERVRTFVGRAAKRGLSNVRALPVSAEMALGQCFEDGSVSEIHVYFPDPWPKERHARNRLVQPWFAEAAQRVLAADGVLRLATDDGPYAAQMLAVLDTDDPFTGRPRFRNIAGRGAVSETPLLGWETKFERLWRAKGRTIRHMGFVPLPRS